MLVTFFKIKGTNDMIYSFVNSLINIPKIDIA